MGKDIGSPVFFRSSVRAPWVILDADLVTNSKSMLIILKLLLPSWTYHALKNVTSMTEGGRQLKPNVKVGQSL